MTPRGIRQLDTAAPDVGSPLLTVIVGIDDDVQTFYIHDDLAKLYSRFFAAALAKGWKEAEDHIVRLPEDVPARFEIFPRFVYFGKIYSAHHGQGAAEDEDEKALHVGAEITRLCECWILGDKLASIAFQDATLDALAQLIHEEAMVPRNAHETVYQHTAGPNSLRRLLVDMAVCSWSSETLKTRRMDAA
ncbi:hypothetical protein LTR08_001752 [Meristemomyces frigidus]|nr:hypothetical protein LTR08_001752 [Meristemomyces frigidus]